MARVGVLLIIAISASVASADPAGAQAEVLFRQGRDLMKANKFAEACAAFAESQKLEPANTTLLNHAGCREKAGQLATAWGLFLEAERATRGANDAANRAMHKTALEHATKLEPRISKLTIRVAHPPEGLEVTRNGQRVDAAMWGRELPIDGGTYQVIAKAPSFRTWSTRVTVAAAKDSPLVEVPDLVKAPNDAEPAHTAVAEGSGEPAPARPAPVERSYIAPIAVGVGALALFGGAVGFDLSGNSTYDRAKAETTDQPHRDSLETSANHKRYAAEGLAIGGIAAAGVAVYLLLRHPDAEVTEREETAAHFAVSPKGFAVVGRF